MCMFFLNLFHFYWKKKNILISHRDVISNWIIFPGLVCRVEVLQRAKTVAIGAGPGGFSVLPADAFKDRS